MKKYWQYVIAIVLLLFIQAYCDLSLPDYTSELIDVGISNYGIEHSVPEFISEQGAMEVSAFMTEEERTDWQSIYEYDDQLGYYKLTADKDQLERLDEEFSDVIAIAYMINSQAGDTVDLSGLNGSDMPPVDTSGMSDEELELFMKMQQSDSGSMLLDMRNALEEQLSSLGDSMIASMAKYFVREQYEICGIDLEKLQSDYLWKTGGKMMLMALVVAVSAILVGFLASMVAAGVGRDLRDSIFRKVMSFSSAELDRFSTASLITRSTNDVQQIQFVTVMLLRMVLYSPILAIGGIINISRYKSGMSWIIVLAVALVLCLVMALMIIAMPKFRIMQELVDKVNLYAREILTGIPVIRAFGREKHEEKRFDEANTDLMRVMLFTNRTMSFMMPALMLVMNGISALIVWVAAKKIDAGVIEVGAMTAFVTYSMLIIMSFLMITMISVMLPRAGVAANRIKEVLDTEPIITDSENAVREAPENTSVRFDHVSFRYPDGGENVLTDIDFIADTGKTTAIIGSTGCGKSTLVKLIPRFFDATEGTVSIGGINVKDMSVEVLRKQIGYVPQKAILFSGDIFSNIAYGADDISEKNIEEAAKIAQAAEFINEKPDGYKSPIAQGGTNVSGGQKQRLSIARAIARDPKIYIFDDSFSALDFKTDTALRKALSEKTKNAAVIIVAQRVSTILNADQIIVLEDGKMVGKGTHRELVASCEEYEQIARSQLSEAEFLRSIEAKEEC